MKFVLIVLLFAGCRTRPVQASAAPSEQSLPEYALPYRLEPSAIR